MLEIGNCTNCTTCGSCQQTPTADTPQLFCMHCQPSKAPCLRVCRKNAIEILGGAITINSEKCDLCADREEGPACIKACTKRAITIADPEKIRAKNQEKYLAKMAGLYEPDNAKGGIVHVLTSQARARLVLDE